jgi:hypothetical protein
MAIALVCVIQLESICELGQERAGVFGERVEVEVVDGNTQELHQTCQRN